MTLLEKQTKRVKQEYSSAMSIPSPRQRIAEVKCVCRDGQSVIQQWSDVGLPEEQRKQLRNLRRWLNRKMRDGWIVL